jgi:hypothetical protein
VRWKQACPHFNCCRKGSSRCSTQWSYTMVGVYPRAYNSLAVIPTHLHRLAIVLFPAHTHTHSRTNMHKHAHTHIHAQTCTNMHTHIHTHIHTCTHTHMHTQEGGLLGVDVVAPAPQPILPPPRQQQHGHRRTSAPVKPLSNQPHTLHHNRHNTSSRSASPDSRSGGVL